MNKSSNFLRILFLMILSINSYACFSQDSKNTEPNLKETQEWLITKIESNGVGKFPAVKYDADFISDCVLTIKEIGAQNEVLNTYVIELKNIDFEKIEKKINKIGTMTVVLKSITLKFVADNNDEFYNRLIKALKRGKVLCGGVSDDKF